MVIMKEKREERKKKYNKEQLSAHKLRRNFVVLFPT